MPLGDWQFWLVTALAAGAMWILIRMFLPKKKPRGRRTTLTVSAKGKRK